MRKAITLLLLVLPLLFGTPAPAAVAPCTKGSTCRCDVLGSSYGGANIKLCEDFDDPLYDDGDTSYGTDQYGTIWGKGFFGTNPPLVVNSKHPAPASGCTDPSLPGGQGLGYRGAEGTHPWSCFNIVKPNTCEFGDTNCVFDGNQSISYRLIPGKYSGSAGSGSFGTIYNVGYTAAIRWSNSYTAPFENGTQAHKMDELGTAGFLFLAGAGTTGGVPSGAQTPFGAGLKPFSSNPNAVINNGLGRFIWAGVGDGLRWAPNAGAYTFVKGTWHCVQFQLTGLNTATTNVKNWIDNIPLVDITFDSRPVSYSAAGISEILWNNFYNGADGLSGIYNGPSQASRYEDNVVITDGAPVPCSAIGFGATQTLTISSVTPTPSSGTAPLNNVAIATAFSGSATGTATYAVDCDNNGSFETSTTGGSSPLSVNCSFASAGTKTVPVKVDRGTAPTAFSSTTVTVTGQSLSISSVTPTPASGLAPLNGVSISTAFSGSAVDGINVITVTGDCDNDGTYEKSATGLASPIAFTCDFPSYGTKTVNVKVNGGTAAAVSSSTTVAVQSNGEGSLPCPASAYPYAESDTAWDWTLYPAWTWEAMYKLNANPTEWKALISSAAAPPPDNGTLSSVLYGQSYYGDIRFRKQLTDQLPSNATLTGTTSWKRLSIRFTGGTYTALLNGVQVAQGTSKTSPGSTSNGKIRLCMVPFGPDYLDGTVADVRLFSEAKSDSWILQHKDCRIKPTTSGLVDYWKLNETAGTSAANSASTPTHGALSLFNTAMSPSDTPSLTATTGTDCVNNNIAQTLSITASPSPSSGTAPLTTQIAISMSGTASGTATVRADCDNNGTYEQAATGSGNPLTVSCTFANAGTYTIPVNADRGTAATATNSTSVTVTAPDTLTLNSVQYFPGQTFTAPDTLYIGVYVLGTATGTINGAFDCDNNGSYETTATSPSTLVTGSCYFNNAGSKTVPYRITRGTAAPLTGNATMTGSNQTLAIDSVTPATVIGPVPITNNSISVAFSGTATGTATVSVDCDNNGSYESTNTGGSSPVAVNCTFSAPGTYIVPVKVDRGTAATAFSATQVQGVVPTLTLGTVTASPTGGQIPLNSVLISVPFSGSATGTFTLQVDCDGDGKFETSGSNTVSPVTASCNYNTVGKKTVNVRLSNSYTPSVDGFVTVTPITKIAPIVIP